MAFHPSKASLILTFLILALSPTAFPITLFDCTIVLYNSSNQSLTAGCKSNGADVGTITVPPLGERVFFSHVLVRKRTVASCSMALGNLHGTFDVLDWGRDKNRCKNKVCFWRINEKGLSLLIDNDFVLQFNWPRV